MSILSLYLGPPVYNIEENHLIATKQEEEYEQQDPIAAFMYGLKAPETKRQWPGRLKVFLGYLVLDDGTFEEKAKQFIEKARQNPQWAQDNLMKFIAFQHRRATSGEISETTIANYYKATKLFCEMNDLVLNWKKITRGAAERKTGSQ